MSPRYTSVAPSAARLTESLRDIGYDFCSAIADLVDNSIAAGANDIDVVVEFAGAASLVYVRDNGEGMRPNGISEALRFGSRRSYSSGDLGRYGLGLKTASLSQCRSLTVLSRRTLERPTVHAKVLDLDLIAEFDDWLVVEAGSTSNVRRCKGLLKDNTGTVVLWEKLDRVVPEANASGAWASRRFERLIEKTGAHLSMVFHRFLEGSLGRAPVSIQVNGVKMSPWNPFAVSESGTVELGEERFELASGDFCGTVRLNRYILPNRDKFSAPGEFDRMSGPLKWNRQQGIYVYRSNRLVQWGGWAGLRSIDEHTKLARASLDFDTDLDTAFNINVSKMRVSIPPQLKVMIERSVAELASLASDSYRKSPEGKNRGQKRDVVLDKDAAREIGISLKSAALQAGEFDAFRKIVDLLKSDMPDIAESLGL
ncbi:ATP-binding protein [Rhodococcus fascians]|nr:ATP-binding protein [Rhodococcus fascians]MBY3996311.1 ATP-binding protein [Rhodococcus fascians]MBY4002974.1 ATP-binding protein [Rhodococcus fascians]MBY4007724.1 ATP-binding protein [Rhodococcus fascians]MBY4017523.1 ATP-binding protein [Rhodococcus fascians]